MFDGLEIDHSEPPGSVDPEKLPDMFGSLQSGHGAPATPPASSPSPDLAGAPDGGLVPGLDIRGAGNIDPEAPSLAPGDVSERDQLWPVEL